MAETSEPLDDALSAWVRKHRPNRVNGWGASAQAWMDLQELISDAETKARADEREQIAQAIEDEAILRPKPAFNYTADYRDGLRGAARIARSQS